MKQNEIDAGLISVRLDTESSRLARSGQKKVDQVSIQPCITPADDVVPGDATCSFVVGADAPRLKDLLTRLPGGRQLRAWNKARRQNRRKRREERRAGSGAPSSPAAPAPLPPQLEQPAAAPASVHLLEHELAALHARLDDAPLRDMLLRMGALEQELAALKREMRMQAQRASGPAAGLSSTPIPVETHDKSRFDSFYIAFEDEFRGARDVVSARLAAYMPHLAAAGVAALEGPVLDIDCGRGEWLELLKREGFNAYGIDLNAAMVEETRAHGLDARCADLLSHLRGVEAQSLGAVTAFHVVEHLPLEVLLDFLDEALRALVPGGLLLLETPNPENILVGACTFYKDPTHRNPIPPEVLQFMARQRGFHRTQILPLHPFPQDQQLRGSDVDTPRLNHLLFGPQDYALLAHRA